MEMDMGTAIIGLIMLAFFALPFLLDRRNRARQRKTQLNTLQDLARQHNCTVHKHEFCGGTGIGLDVERNALFFFSKRDQEAITRYVDLGTVRSCRAANATRTMTGANGEMIMDRVELCLVPKDRNAEELRLGLYHSGAGTSLNGELQFAEQWARLINDRLGNK